MSGPEPDTVRREALRALLTEERWQLTAVRTVAEEVGCNANMVAEVRMELGLEASPVAARRKLLFEILAQPGARALTTAELVARTGLGPATVSKLRKNGPKARVRLIKPATKVTPTTLRGLDSRQVMMLRELFARALRGADVQCLVLSSVGRDVHRAVIAASTLGVA